jgi:hypothetical protein
MIKSLKVSNVANMSYQLHFNAEKQKEISFKISNFYLYNMLLLTCDDKSDPAYFIFPFSILNYLGTEYFNDLCFSVGSPKINSKIIIEFFYFNTEINDYEIINYILIFNQEGIVNEIFNDINLRTKDSSKYVSELPELILSYFQSYYFFNCMNDLQINKHYSISLEMIESSSIFKKFIIDFFNYLGYIINDIFIDNEELYVIYKYSSGKIDVESDNELKLIVSLSSLIFIIFMRQGVFYLSNISKVLPHESTVLFYEMMSINDNFRRKNNCQFIIQESHEIFDFLYNSNFSINPIIEDTQIIKVIEYFNRPIVEWKRN